MSMLVGGALISPSLVFLFQDLNKVIQRHRYLSKKNLCMLKIEIEFLIQACSSGYELKNMFEIKRSLIFWFENNL